MHMPPQPVTDEGSLPRFRSNSARVILTTLLYVIAYPRMASWLRSSIGILSIIPTITIAWLSEMSTGVAMGVLMFPLS